MCFFIVEWNERLLKSKFELKVNQNADFYSLVVLDSNCMSSMTHLELIKSNEWIQIDEFDLINQERKRSRKKKSFSSKGLKVRMLKQVDLLEWL